MTDWLQRLRSGLSVRAAVLGLGIVAALGVVAAGLAIEASSQPVFCGSCHIMRPYYASWKISSHNQVACVDCHIPPGTGAELRKKFEAISMVARYFTATWGTKPWAEVDDAACLQCHERRLLAGKAMFHDVLFDHGAHLAEMRRGKTLRCTSCHSQIVQGSHITVTPSTCILCHFKDQPSDTGTARCTLCHPIPSKVVEKGGFKFDHGDVARFGMGCTNCHARPQGSNGDVPRERCVTCHNDPPRLAKYDDVDLMHRTHVSEHKVDCLNCHLEIEHVDRGQVNLEHAVAACDTCHAGGHSPQLSLYTGVSGRGVEPTPSAMYQAGVRCEGCHIQIPGRDTDIHRADAISCMRCHGPGYARIFDSWQGSMATRTTALAGQMADTETRIDPDSDAAKPLADARFNLDLVTRGKGVHNVGYARKLLDRAHSDMNAARRQRGLEPKPLPWSGLESPCFACHAGIETQEGKIFGKPFRHEPHLTRAKLDCASCHRTHDEGAAMIKITADSCQSCHHAKAGKGGKIDCISCHAGIRKTKVQSFLGLFNHALHLDDAELGCTDCHDGDNPTKVDPAGCETCHDK